MKKFKVDSISKYLAIIEENDISNYIYRGQNEPYFSIQASGFRPYMGGRDSDKIYDMPHIHSAFYDRIIGQLSVDEKKYFLAFCQHHGIPTNLVDVSYSPLVALFFACDGKGERKFTLSEFIGNKSIDDFERAPSNQKMFIHNLINQAKKPFYSSYAQIYMIDKRRLINITDLIVELYGKNLYEELLINETLLSKLLLLITEQFKTIPSTILDTWSKNILAKYVEISELHGYSSPHNVVYSSAKQALSVELSTTTYLNLISTFDGNYSYHLNQYFFNPEIMEEDPHNLAALLYTNVLMVIIETLKSAPEKINLDLDIYFTYQPPQLFKRIASQQSFFIYQPYLYTNDGVYDYCELNVQSINPDILIEVDNYSNILRELNILGIDNGSIYGDIDNIAKSVLSSSGKLLKD